MLVKIEIYNDGECWCARALGEGILELSRDKALSKRMAEFGYNRATKELSWQSQEPNLLEAYKYVLKK